MSQLSFRAPPSQPRTVTPEAPSIYAAVLKLRRAAFTVYRRGRTQHLVRPPGRRARILSDRDMIRLARGMVV